MDGYIRIKAVLDERFKNTELIKLDTEVITEQINGLSDYDKLKEIVLYFLRNNTICEIAQQEDKVVITSTSLRKLIFRLGYEYQELLNIVIDKYKNDRLKFIEESNISNLYIQTVHLDKFKIVSGTTNYYSGIDIVNKPLLVLTLASSASDIASFDKSFIISYINNIINSSEETIISHRIHHGMQIYCCGKSIRIPGELIDQISTMIRNRNYEISKMNSKQYKLEVRK